MRSTTRKMDWTWRHASAVTLLAVLAVAAVAAIEASGSSGRAGAGTLVKIRKTGLGRVLADQRGLTLYLFEPDRFGRSVCTGKCATFWPPVLTAGKPRAAAGAQAALLGTTKRAGGKLQVTYQGYPLYRFVKDTKPGSTAGQGVDAFGGEWYVLDAQGRKIEDGRHGGDAATVAMHKTALGRVLTDGRGRTLYLFEADKGTTSACYGQCAAFWPPLLTTGKPQAAAGARAGLLGTTTRKDGTEQVTYRGHPLYYFAKDEAEGNTSGEAIDAFGAEWYALNAAGTKVEQHGKGGGSDDSTTTPPPPRPQPAGATAEATASNTVLHARLHRAATRFPKARNTVLLARPGGRGGTAGARPFGRRSAGLARAPYRPDLRVGRG